MLPPRPGLSRDARGLPLAGPLETRLARAVLVVATAFFALAAAWEMFGPLLAGHYASSASVGIIADNMLRWHIPGPVWEYTRAKPGPGAYYCHHPWGIFWTTALLMKLFGRHDYICRLAPVLLSAATPPLLYALGRSIWRPAAGAAAALGFVVLPIALAFANFNALEVPVIAWSLLFLWGYVRLGQTGERRFLFASLFGLVCALHADWPAFVLGAGVLGLVLVRAYIARPFFGRLVSERRYFAFWAFAATAAVGTFVLYLGLFAASGKIGDLFGSYTMRSSGSQMPLAAVLASRRYWNELMFTPIAIAIGKLGALVALGRFVWSRREHEAVPLLVLLMATVQYVVFKQGADIHIFWPHYFAAYFALTMGALTATLASLFERARRRIPKLAFGPQESAAALALGISLLPLAAIARDGIPALVYARATGGRFNEKGLLIHSDGQKTAFLRFIEPGLAKDATVEMHEGMKTTWSQVWTLGGRLVAQGRPIPKPGRVDARNVYLADTRFLLNDQQGELAAQYHVTAVGPFWKVSPAEPKAPIDAYAIVEREPSAFEWYFISGTEPHRDIAPDPYRTWELRHHFDQPATPPAEPPRTLEEKRIAHNIAVAAGDDEKARALYAEIERELWAIHARFDDGTEIVGSTFHEGARPLLTLYVLAGGPTKADVQLTVKSKVVARAPLSLTMADPTEREVGIPVAIAPQRWKKGFLYSDPIAIRKRPGTEEFWASFWVRGRGAAPRPASGSARAAVLTLR